MNAEGTGIEPEAIIGSKQLSRLPPSPSGFTFLIKYFYVKNLLLLPMFSR